MTNSRRVVLGVILIVPALAQEHPSGFFLTSPLSISSGYDDNFVTSSQKLDDVVTLLGGPAFTWIRSTHRTSLSLDYQPEFEIFSRNPDLDSWNHASTFRFLHQINATMSVDGGNLLNATMDPARRLANSLLLLPRGRYVENAAYAGLTYRWTQLTKLTFRVDNAITTMDLRGPMAGRLDQATTAGTATIEHSLTSRQKVTGSYSFLHVNPFHPEVWGSATNVHLMVAGYNYEINPELLVRVSGGLVKGSDVSFTGAASVDKKFGELWVSAFYQRYLSFFGGVTPVAGAVEPVGAFASGLTPTSIYQTVGIRARGRLSRQVGLEGSAQRVLNGLDPQFREVKGVIAQVRVDYKLTERLTAFVRAEHYTQNINQFTNSDYSRNRYFGGIEIALFHSPERDNPRTRHGKTPQESKDLPVEPPSEEKIP